MWRRGRVLDCKSENLGSRTGDVTFEKIQFCRRSSTFVKVCRKSSLFIVKFSSGMSETFFDTCVNWSCVTRCGCRTTSSTLFTVKGAATARHIIDMVCWVYCSTISVDRSTGGGILLVQMISTRLCSAYRKGVGGSQHPVCFVYHIQTYCL